MITVYDRGREVAVIHPPGVCIPCGSRGYLIVPCRRDDPQRLTPACAQAFPVLPNWPALPPHDADARCDTLGCRNAVKTITCPYHPEEIR